MRTTHLIAIAGMAAALAVALGVYFATASGPPAAQPASPASPVRVALVVDSLAPAPVSLAELESLVTQVTQAGGELFVGVAASSGPAVVRLRVDPPPAAPAARPANGDAISRARDRAAQERDDAAYQAAHRDWDAATKQRVASFAAAATTVLDAQRDPSVDVWPTLDEASLFLGEDASSWPSPPHDWLVLVSARDAAANKCRDVFGRRSIPPGTSFVDRATGVVWTCLSNGEWSASGDAGSGSTTPGSGVPTPPGLVPPSAKVVLVKSGTLPGVLAATATFGSVDAAVRYVLAGEGAR